MSKKVVVYVPLTHSDAIREAIGNAGGGRLGKYSFCTFSTKGTGRFKPDMDANPHIGTNGELEAVEEERIEVTVEDALVSEVIKAIKAAHPYEEVAMDVYPLENI